MDLFARTAPDALLEPDQYTPLADRLRPRTLSDIVGQDHLLGPQGTLTRALSDRKIGSMILWGPPGCGKTTLARLLAQHTDLAFEPLSAVFTGLPDLRKSIEGARLRRTQGRGTLLFIDEIHRFNKAQQDAFLPVVEDGTIVLVGATTENPSFALNSALLSRCVVHVLHRLDEKAIETLFQRAESFYGRPLPVEEDARAYLYRMADGDGRHALILAEQVFESNQALDIAGLQGLLTRRAPIYDSHEEQHYNLISALHKSVRGSDVDAALYWMARMLAGGEDPHYLARRIVRMAVEDIGLADPQALRMALDAWETYERLGSPEGELALVQALIYVATAPKSNAVYKAFYAMKSVAAAHGSVMPPKHILNAPTRLMKEEGYGAGYQYDHDDPDGFSGQSYFPDDMARQELYHPQARGFEREIEKRLIYWGRLRETKSSKKS